MDTNKKPIDVSKLTPEQYQLEINKFNTQGQTPVNTAVPPVITSDMLKPQPELKLPEKAVPAPSPILAEADALVQTSLEKQAADAKKTQDTNVSDITQLMEAIGGVEGKRGQYQEDAGVFVNQDAIKDIDDQLLVQSRALKARNEEIRRNPQLTQSMAARLMNEEERKAASTTADLMVTRSLLNRDVDRAIEIANRKVEAELAPLKTQLEAKKFVFDNNKDWLSTLQKTALETAIKKDEREITKKEDIQKKNEEMYIQASLYEAPADVLSKARKAINEGKDNTEVAEIIGKYAADPIERAIKQAQLAKLNQDISQDRTKFNERNAVVSAGDIISTLPKAQQDRYYKLQNDFDATSKTYRGAIDAANNIKALSKDSTAQDQTAIIFSYMKTLDPSSTVREGEFALVGKTAGLSDLAVNALKKLDSGKRLNEQQIADIVGAANKLANQSKKNLDATSAEYDRRASKFGLPSGLFYEPQEIPKLTEDEFVETLIPSKQSSPFSIFNKKFR